jgi:hypothetical protein
MRPAWFIAAIICPASFTSAELSLSNLLQLVVPGFKSKSLESTKATLVELGIDSDHATDTSKIVHITDSNWKDYLGPQNTDEWLIEFTADPEHCGSCEIIDLAFNVIPPCPELTPGCLTSNGNCTSRDKNRKNRLFRGDCSLYTVYYY